MIYRFLLLLTALFIMENLSAQGGYNYETHCFASREKAHNAENAYNYHFVRLHVEPDNSVRGAMIGAPYGTDGYRGSMRGMLRAESGEIMAEANALAEGSINTGSRNYKLEEGALVELSPEMQVVSRIPKVSCEEYDNLYQEYQKRNLQYQVNTTDRTRLLKVKALEKMGLSASNLNTIKFMERELDLDRNYETREFLLYVMDPMLCGSGGCNLFVINEAGKVLSEMSVVKLPVYTLTSKIDDRSRKGQWKELFVSSKGLRRLVPADGQYPSNPSMEPRVLHEQMLAFPEDYQLVLDYLD